MNRFYLNGRIVDSYRKVLIGNAAVSNLGELDEDEKYFNYYHEILLKSLNENNNALHSMDNFTIFDPFGYFTYKYATNLINWDSTDFVKADIKKLCNDGYDYMVLLPKWWKCKEAWIKFIVARAIGVKITTFKKLIKELS